MKIRNPGLDLLATEEQLLEMLRQLPGWQTMQVLYSGEQNGGNVYTVHLTAAQAAVLGEAMIRQQYATPFQDPDTRLKTIAIEGPAPRRGE